MKKVVSIKVADESECADVPVLPSYGAGYSTTPLSSARSSGSSNEEYEAILHMLRGPPLKYRPILTHLSIGFVVLVVSAFILLAPVLIVWGINTKYLNSLSTQRRDEALVRRAESFYSTLTFSTSHCERLIMDHAYWLQGLQRTGNELQQIYNTTNWGWSSPARDEKCGGGIIIYLDNGKLSFTLSNSSYALVTVQSCLTCSEKSYILNPTTGILKSGGSSHPIAAGPPSPPAAKGLYFYINKISNLSLADQLNQLYPVWTRSSVQSNTLIEELFIALKRNLTDSYPPSYSDTISGLIRFDIRSSTVTAALATATEQSGIIGTYVVDPDGYIIATTLEDISTSSNNTQQNFTHMNNGTNPNSTQYNNTHSNSTQGNPFGRLIMANESSVAICRDSYANMPTDLTAAETKIVSLDGYPLAYTKLVSDYGFEATIVTVGDADYFFGFAHDSSVASGITLALSLFIGGLIVVALASVVFLGLNSIKKAVNWLIEDQLDGSALMLRGEDGEFDKAAVERMVHAKYKMRVYFSEMNAIGQSVERMAINNRELKAFFPSMFVGLSKDEIKSGAHKSNLRFKFVSVMFVDIVRFSPMCAANEANLDTILQSFFGILESPVFKKKGLTKRLGDGFMAAFGFATPDNDFDELCKRAHDCTRLIVKNLPKVNSHLATRLPYFPPGGIKIRIGLSAGKASIGVVQTDAMSNADVYGEIVNLGQRMEDSGRYKGITPENVMIPYLPEETPRCVITMIPEVFKSLDARGELAKYGVEVFDTNIMVKGETTPRLVYRCIAEDLAAPTIC